MLNTYSHYVHLFYWYKVRTFYAVWCYITNAVNKNAFAWIFVYLDFIWIKILDTDHITEKLVGTIFDVDFFYTIDPSTVVMIILDFFKYLFIFSIERD